MKPSNIVTAILLLKRARDAFERGNCTYICHTLPDVAEGPAELEVANELVGYIEHTLRKDVHGDGKPDATNILEEVVPHLPVRGYADLRHMVHVSPNAKLTDLIRMAWLDAMIRDLTTKGTLP